MFNRHFDPFNLLVHQKSGTLFVLNPKVMTSFTRRLVNEGIKDLGSEAGLSCDRFPWLKQARSFPLQPISFYFRLAFNQENLSVFTLVRNPYTRLFSAWKDKFYDPHKKGGGEEAFYPRSMRNSELKDFRLFAKKSGLEGAKNQTLVPFSTFLARIEAQKEGRRNHHWDTQFTVLQAHHFKFTGIFKYETEREECFDTIFGRMGFDKQWIRKKLAYRVNSTTSDDTKLISIDDLERVSSIFKRDFDFFGYEKSIPNALVKYLKD